MATSLFKSKIRIFLVFALLLNLLSCDKDDEFSQVPYAMVDIQLGVYNELALIGVGQYIEVLPGPVIGQIKLRNKYNNSENTVGGTFTGKGLILYHYANTNDGQEWNAYDNTCTYQPLTDNAAVEIIDENFAVCPKCSSKFLLLDGSPQSGSKAPRPLKMYKSVYDAGTATLMVYN